MKVLFAGCGDIAERVAAVLGEKANCTGVRRRSQLIPDGIEAISADFCSLESLQSLNGREFDYVVVSFTPYERSLEAYERSYVEASKNLAAVLGDKVKRVFYISSTAVYPQADHSIVTEQSETASESYGQLLVAAENVWRESNINATVLRLSGIYGDQRKFFLNSVRNGATAPAEPHYTNRIHVDDAAKAIAFLIEKDQQNLPLDDLYNVTDTLPVLMADVVSWLQDQITMNDSQPKTLNRRGGSKQVSSAKLQALGFCFNYPDFKSGYQAMIDSELS